MVSRNAGPHRRDQNDLGEFRLTNYLADVQANSSRRGVDPVAQ